ncbi:hypothetical protein [Rhodanobacter sp. MP7CTX1]|uniref:hypothetical protein n=1 Tax=Rhodanobacter sp. MP7CTX1 TaxID=2723084 RepID=UPI0016177B20|nr:hypothetical protein [Rhodanobacter sp. MP7CTX1]MBB6186724.1 hypothetical protein [Rhodanobacter sp. MP7CTX1]
MDELLAKATQGVDPDAPGAFWHILVNLLNMVPWAAMFWWNVLFIAVGALLGWWRGRLVEGVVWAAALGPIGWVVILTKPRPRPSAQPPPLPR